MKTWQTVLFSILITLLAGGVIVLASRPPRGAPVRLLPRPTPTPLVVHLIGAVQNPGVYELPPGSRVRDLVAAAGGFSAQADTQRVNQAAFLEDSSQIYIPTLPPMAVSGSSATQAPAERASAERGSTIPLDPPAPGGEEKLVDINSATLEELDTLPGIGPAIAGRIIDYRQTNGPFETIEEIQEVSGIGPVTFERLKTLITVDPQP